MKDLQESEFRDRRERGGKRGASGDRKGGGREVGRFRRSRSMLDGRRWRKRRI